MLLDIFAGDAFSCMELTNAINRIPYKPGKIARMNLFDNRGITTTVAVVEEKDGVLSLIPTAARGGIPAVAANEDRHARNFTVPHLPLNATVRADEVQNVRAFGKETELEAVAGVVNDKIASMRQSHETTLEYHRLGAIKGNVVDADGVTVIYNMFTEFGCTQPAPVVGGFAEFDFTAATPPVADTCRGIIRMIEANLGNAPYDHIHCFCDATFYDGLTGQAAVLASYGLWNQGNIAAMAGDRRDGFPYGGIVFEEYTGVVGAIPMIEAGAAYFFPVGSPGLFTTINAPADYIETVNTKGKPFYAKQQLMDFDRGVMISTQSNPLCLCTRPMALIRARFV